MRPLFGFCVPPESCPTLPSPPAAANRHLSWAFAPYSTCRLGDPLFAGLPCPLRSALRVWLPSRRFSPAKPLPVLFHTGSAPGIRPSELSPPGRSPHVSARPDPRAVHPAGAPIPPRRAGPAQTGRGFWALTLPRVPGDDAGFNSRAAGCSLGLFPSRVCGDGLARALTRAPPSRFCWRPPYGERPPAPRSLSVAALSRPQSSAGRRLPSRQPS